jgi:hypothetical protein
MRSVLFVLTSLFCFACGPMNPTPDAGNNACNGAAKTPANLIENGSFECEGGWRAVIGELAFVDGGRTGRAAQGTVGQGLGSTTTRFATIKPVLENAGNKTYCVTAWLKGTVPFMRVRALRENPDTVVEFSEQVFSDWRRIPTLKFTGDNAARITIVFEAQSNRGDGQNAMLGQSMLIDDVDVWESSNNCMEPR